MKYHIYAFASALLAFSPLQMNANAQEQQTVSYDDLDISTSLGRSLLMTRVYSAAKVVCGEGSEVHRQLNYLLDKARRECVRDAVGQALLTLEVRTAHLSNAEEGREATAR
ncbi:MAG: UrcA family protein [Alphaproteobacteria bacterium]|nr:UrcA family protein [Alphaproteobacteria bacterium]